MYLVLQNSLNTIFREDLQVIPEVSELKPVGREKWNYRDYTN
jgi:hypothetical protein